MEIQLSPGSTFDKNYEIISFIGSGGMGSVYKARQKGLERIVALKILKLDQLSDQGNIARFEREARSLSALHNNHIAQFYNYGRAENGLNYIVMEYLEGRSLKQVLRAEDKLDWKRACMISKQICAAMTAAHQQGTINRDLKPENIILLDQAQKDFVKIIDFGLAKLINESDERNEATLTRTGELVGTVHYLSPEQCRGKAADERSDIYALGCILYEMIIGVPPFDADNPIGILHKHASEDLTFPPSTKIELALKKIIKHATAKEPEKRYQTMRQFQDDLSNLEAGQEHLVTAQTEEVADRSRTQTPLNKLMVPLALTALGAAIAAGALFLWINNTPDGAVLQAKTALANATDDKRLHWLSEADKLEEQGDQKHAQSIIDAVRMSYGADVFSFFRLQNEHATKLLAGGAKKEANKWAWRTIFAVDKDSSPKTELVKESYNNILDDASRLIIKADQPLSKQQTRVFQTIANDRTSKYRHYSEKEAMTELAFLVVMNTEQNLGYEISESLVYHTTNFAKRGRLTQALKQTPSILKKMAKIHKKATATAESIRLYTQLANSAIDVGRRDLATALIGKAEKMCNVDADYAFDFNLTNFYRGAGYIYMRLGRLKDAVTCNLKARELATDAGQKAASDLELAVVYRKMGQLQNSAKFAKEALELTKSDNNPANFNMGLSAISNLGSAYQMMGEQELILDELAKHLSYLESNNNNQALAPHIFTVLTMRAHYYCYSSKHAQAKADFDSAEKLITDGRLGQEQQARLLRERLECALLQKNTSQIQHVLNEIESLPSALNYLATVINPALLKQMRASNPALTDQLIACFVKQMKLMERDRISYPRNAKMLASILLMAGELDGARKIVAQGLASGLLVEETRNWFKEKESLLKSDHPPAGELTKKLSIEY